MQITPIEWVRGADGAKGYTWNPTSGCSLGCHYCYAAAMARRFHRSFAPTCHPERLDQPLRLKKPSRIFVDSAGDLFDAAIPDEFIGQVFGVMALCSTCRPQMTFIVLTKQARRMRDFAQTWRLNEKEWQPDYPLPNLHLGVTVTNQRDADERIPLLLQTPATVRFVSVEPLLGYTFVDKWLPVAYDLDATLLTPKSKGIDWVIVGGLTPKPVHQPQWVQSLINQCRMAGVPLFLKDNLLWPEQIKEYPR